MSRLLRCVGGPADGEAYWLADHHAHLVVPEPVEDLTQLLDPEAPAAPSFKTTTYHVAQFLLPESALVRHYGGPWPGPLAGDRALHGEVLLHPSANPARVLAELLGLVALAGLARH